MRIVAALLLLPVLAITFANLVLPTLLTIRASFYEIQMMSDASEFVGLANYSELLQTPAFWSAAVRFSVDTLIQIVIVSLVPIVVSMTLRRQSKPISSTLNAFFCLPIAFFVPISAMLLVFLSYRQFGPGLVLSVLKGLLSLGIAASLGCFWYGAVWRAEQAAVPQNRLRFSALLSWIISILLVASINLQSFLGEYLFKQRASFGLLYHELFFQLFRFGTGQALASLLIILLASLGLAATLLIIVSDLRIFQLDARPEPQSDARPSGVGIVAAGAILLLSLWPVWLLLAKLPEAQNSAVEPAQNLGLIGTLLSASIGTLLQLLLAYPAALAIGALRPLGRHSEWLLLLFAPWLLVGLLPLLGQYYMLSLRLGLLSSWLSFFSPIIVNVPLIFLFTLFFKGQACNERADAGFFERFIRPSWPLLLASAVVLFLLGWRSVVWNFITAHSSEHWNIQTAQLAAFLRGGKPASVVQLLIDHFVKLELPISIVAALCLSLLSNKLQRLAVRSGR